MSLTEEEQNVVKIRRTERTRRERPDFFNPMMIEDQQKRARKRVRYVVKIYNTVFNLITATCPHKKVG